MFADNGSSTGTTRAAIRWGDDYGGIVTLTLDAPDQGVNTLTADFVRDFGMVVNRLEREREVITGVIIRSAKSTFMAGGDLNRLVAAEPSMQSEFYDDLEHRKSLTRRLESLGRPVVALIEGSALGGGLELALACHHRIAVASSRTVVGLPEATLGILPGGGGLVRVTRLLGPYAARTLIASGAKLDLAQARAVGLIDEIAESSDGALLAARRWIRENPTAAQPWDRDELRRIEPGECPTIDRLAALPITNPDPQFSPNLAIIDQLIRNACTSPFDDSLKSESAGFTEVLLGIAAKATIDVAFFQTTAQRRRTSGSARADRVVLFRPTDPAALERCRELGLPTDPRDAPEDAAVVQISGENGELCGTNTARILRDRVQPAEWVIEYTTRDPLSASVAASLVRTGVVAIRVRATKALNARIDEGVEREVVILRSEGLSTAAIHAARVSAGLCAAPDDDTGDRTSSYPLAVRLLDAASAAARDAADDGILHNPQDLAVAACRIGGVPAWTGGPLHWLARHDSVLAT